MNERRYEGRGILVSGGTSGIGLAAARRFAAEGARVWILGTKPETLAAGLSELPKGQGSGSVCDVSREDEVETSFRDALGFLGRLDAAFVNAGIDGKGDPALKLDAGFFRRVLDVNLIGAFLVAREAARAMPDGGAIVLNGSASGLEAEANFVDYNTSKAGVVMLGRTLAVELGPQGVWVTVVCPGYIRTRMTAEYLDDPDNHAAILGAIPSGRVGTVDEVAALVAFLASPEAKYMNGAVVTIDGGRLA
jgi:NAD(P)-dependent dehydrogenase (short-subunit alcohol dehydrogenase family)